MSTNFNGQWTHHLTKEENRKLERTLDGYNYKAQTIDLPISGDSAERLEYMLISDRNIPSVFTEQYNSHLITLKKVYTVHDNYFMNIYISY